MSCLFRSLAHFIEDTDETQLRGMLVDYLEKNPTVFDSDQTLRVADILEGGHSLTAYAQGMRSPTAWGGAIEIMAFVNLFQVCVRVQVLQTGRTIDFYPTIPRERGALYPRIQISWNGAHYEPVTAST